MNTRTPLRTLYGLVAWLHVIVGAGLAIQGPALPHIRATFGLSLFGVSWLFPAMSLGHLLGVLGSGVPSVTHRRRLITVFGTAMLTSGFAALGGAPYWGVALAAALVLGLGFGCLDVTLNAAVGDGVPQPRRKARVLNVLHTFFSVGTLLGPLLWAWGLEHGATWRQAHWLGALLLAPSLLAALIAWYPAAPPPRAARPPAWRLLLADASLRWLALMMLLYVGVEVGIAAWLTTYMIELHGAAPAAGARATAAFWAALLVGRLAAGRPHRAVERPASATRQHERGSRSNRRSHHHHEQRDSHRCICARRVLYRRYLPHPRGRSASTAAAAQRTNYCLDDGQRIGWLACPATADGCRRRALGCWRHHDRRSGNGKRDAGDWFSRPRAVVCRRRAPLFEVIA